MRRQQGFQHAAADRRQPLLAGRADRLGVRYGIAGAALMVMIAWEILLLFWPRAVPPSDSSLTPYASNNEESYLYIALQQK